METSESQKKTKEKIIILGGGVSAVTAAFGLTSIPDWQDRYEITLYQLGWRLGGKGASGRNPHYFDRIEEHGLHIWFGFYENAFRIIQDCYQELNRYPDAPLQKWEDAFHPHSFIVLEEYWNNKWQPWVLNFPTDQGVPGTGFKAITPWRSVVKILEFMSDLARRNSTLLPTLFTIPKGRKSFFRRKFNEMVADLTKVIGNSIFDSLIQAAKLAQKFETLLPNERLTKSSEKRLINQIIKTFLSFLHEILGSKIETNNELRRIYIGLNLAGAIVRGMVADDVVEKGFDSINHYEFREWIEKYGADPKYTINSALVIGLYDLVFGYEKGDIKKPNIEAGTGLRICLRVAFGSKGAVMWKMQAGMGDTIFGPMYEVLKRRGVKFEFFHEVAKINVNPETKKIREIALTRQVQLKNGTYDPLVSVRNLPCWPSEPLYEQIEDQTAALLKQENVNLESFWSNWPEIYKQHFKKPLDTIILDETQFDRVILGISIGSFPFICDELIKNSDSFAKMVQNIQTVQTQAFQLWLKKNLIELGWDLVPPSGEPPVLGTFVEPIDTWADMTHLLIRENWPSAWPDKENIELVPANLAYFCGVLKDPEVIPPSTDRAFPATQKESVKRQVLAMLKENIKDLWPNAASKGDFRWDWFVDPNAGEGETRFDSQFWRANIDPSDRYVLSTKNTTKHRLDTDQSGFSNLYLTGDWIKTGINAGCVEAAVMAGLQTSRAICGYPKVIDGETDF